MAVVQVGPLIKWTIHPKAMYAVHKLYKPPSNQSAEPIPSHLGYSQTLVDCQHSKSEIFHIKI